MTKNSSRCSHGDLELQKFPVVLLINRVFLHCRLVESVGSINELQHEMDEMKKELMFAQSPVVFCHNDLTAGNIIYNKDTGTGISECASYKPPLWV